MINLIALSIVLGGQAIALTGKGVVKKDDIAGGAITGRNLAPGVVTKTKIRRAAVTDGALATRAVTGRTIKPSSVHGVALDGPIPSLANIADADPPGPMGADGNWTLSGSTASCPRDAVLLGGGIRIRNPGNGRAFVQTTAPSSSSPQSWVGGISTDTGGTSPAELVALCLR